MQTCHDGSQRDAARALDIVVEASNFWAILVQDSFGVEQAEVLAAENQDTLLMPILNKRLTSGYKPDDSASVLL